MMRVGARVWAITQAWNRFFHTPESATTAGLFRILFGLLCFANALILLPDVGVWFTDAGVMSRATLTQVQGYSRIHFLTWVPDSLVPWLFAFFMLATVFLTLGLFTRTAAIIVYLGLVSIHHRNPFILNSGDTVLRVMSFFLIFTHAGKALSFDRLIGVARGNIVASAPFVASPWAMRMIQIQLAIAYLATALWKSQGALWGDGTAVYYTNNLYEFKRFELPGIFQTMPMIQAMTWGTLFVEFAIPLLIWVPRLRYPMLVAGLGLHLGIELTMNIPLFQWIMIASLTSFVAPADLSAMAERSRAALARWIPLTLKCYFDGTCVFCRRSRDVVACLDVLKRVEWIDFRKTKDAVDFARAESEMLLRDGAGRWHGGFFAFRRIAWSVPLLMPFAPFLYLPGVSWGGAHVYRWVAANRYLLLGARCDDESGTCRLHRR